jgi:hypothetical protein
MKTAIGAVALAISLIVTAAAAESNSDPSCEHRARVSRVVAASPQTLVYRTRGRGYLACSRRDHRVTALPDLGGNDFGGGASPVIALLGNAVAVGGTGCTRYEPVCGIEVEVYDARTSKRIASAGENAEFSSERIARLVVSPSGRVAFTAYRAFAGQKGELRFEPALFVVSGDSFESLDSGPSLDAKSLAVSGRRIYWTINGVARTALLEASS